jgi:hypothetical protein
MPDEQKMVEWQCPPVEVPGTYRKGWLDELVQNGERFAEAQPGLKHLSDDIRLLMGVDQDRDLESNLLQPDIRSFVETVTDLRQIATMGSRAEQFKKTVALYNEALRFIYWDSSFVHSTRKAIQYAMLGRGYLWQKFSRDRYGWGKAKIHFDPLGPRECLLEQLPSDNDVQGCYAGTIVRIMPIAEAHARFPKFQQYLVPLAQYHQRGYLNLGLARRMDFYDRYRFVGNENQQWPEKYCEVRYHFIRDLRLNDTGREMQMGVDGETWGYKVPYLGQLLVTQNPYNQLPESRKAVMDDCRVYPMLRLAISSPSVPIPMYDDTGFDWHGEIPVVQYDVNDWVWSPMGYSAVRQVAGMEVARRDRLSEINEVLAVRKDPPMGHDLSAGVPRTQLEKLDLLHAKGIRIGLKGDPKKAMGSILPDSMDIDDKDFKGVELLTSFIKGGLGLTDLASLREIKGNLSEESMDKFIENLGPMAKGIATNMWMANSKHANMLKYNIAQYITVAELMNMVGPESVGLETFDNDPNALVPSHLPGELTTSESRHKKQQRARWFCELLRVINTPSQLLNVTHIQERMLSMFLLQKGVPIDTAGTMEKMGVEDYHTRHEAWKKEQLDDAMWKLEVQKAVMLKMKELGIEPPPEQGPGQGQGGGRPASGQKGGKPAMKGKRSGDVRVVNSTS